MSQCFLNIFGGWRDKNKHMQSTRVEDVKKHKLKFVLNTCLFMKDIKVNAEKVICFLCDTCCVIILSTIQCICKKCT